MQNKLNDAIKLRIDMKTLHLFECVYQENI